MLFIRWLFMMVCLWRLLLHTDFYSLLSSWLLLHSLWNGKYSFVYVTLFITKLSINLWMPKSFYQLYFLLLTKKENFIFYLVIKKKKKLFCLLIKAIFEIIIWYWAYYHKGLFLITSYQIVKPNGLIIPTYAFFVVSISSYLFSKKSISTYVRK